MIFEWKTYQSACIIAAGQDGREYRVARERGKWSAAVYRPSKEPVLTSERIDLGKDVGLEDAIQLCKMYEIKKVLDLNDQGPQENKQLQDTTD